ncbi:hypothetical protein [Sphingomonas endolithica]|uniref:hypothetical protein n=1 Tax=Sphingomonas endolithica TaxID=2972485 RepID=UPI0021AF15DC|nr:hypothetical protein [Sphingomonas sp. ZFBP2030]
MATVHVTLSKIDDRADTGGTMPVITSVPEAAQTLTSSDASTASTVASTPDYGLFWTVTARDGDVYVAFGAAPVAGANEGHLVLAGQTRDFGISADGEKIAVKDA